MFHHLMVSVLWLMLCSEEKSRLTSCVVTAIDYGTLLVECADGLREESHPYAFVARTAFKELVLAEVWTRLLLFWHHRIVLT
jgi:Parkin co-regulated protein